MNEFRAEQALALASYGATNHIQKLLDGIKALCELHCPMDDGDTRCKTCRDSRGRPEPFPCTTYMVVGSALGLNMPAPETVELWRTLGAARNGSMRAISKFNRMVAALEKKEIEA